MTERLLLDTHIALWLDSGDERLRPATRELIDACWRDRGTVFFSAVSAWEIALLVDRERIELDVPVESWLERFLDRPGFEALPLRHVTAARAYQIQHWEYRDPADRLLIATAIDEAASLVTYDERIVNFGRQYGRRYGLAVSAGSAASR